MNNWGKLTVIVVVTAGVLWLLRGGSLGGAGGGVGGKLPESLSGLVSRAEALDRKVVVLITGSAWCPPCRQMERTLLKSPEWASYAANEVVFMAWDYPDGGRATTPAHQELREMEGVRGFPTMVVADRKGRILAMRSGFDGDAAAYLAWLRGI